MKILVLACDTCEPLAPAALDQLAAGDGLVAATVLAQTTPQAAMLALMELVPLPFLNAIKLTTIGRVQRRRQKAERPAAYQDEG